MLESKVVNWVLQPQLLARIKTPGFVDQSYRQRPPKPPVAPLVGIDQRGLGDRFSDSQVLERVRVGVQARFNIPQSFSPVNLRERQANQLLANS
jgi:hypothetical protein